MKAKHLVADTAAFVKNVPLWEYGEEICSIPEVIGEIRDKHTKQHIQSLPVKIELKQPKPESIKFINEFSKKTGDFGSLSLADIKVLALTYELEVEAHGGSDHLHSEPEKSVTEFRPPKKSTGDALLLPGFYYPSEQSEGNVVNSISSVSSDESETDKGVESAPQYCSLSLHPSVYTSKAPDICWRHMIGLESFLEDNSYIQGYLPTTEDWKLYTTLTKDYPQFYPSHKGFRKYQIPFAKNVCPLQSTFPHIWRWASHISTFSEKERESFQTAERSLADILRDFGERAENMEGEECQQLKSQVPLDIGSLSIGEDDEQSYSVGEDGDSNEEKVEQDLNEQEEEEEEEYEYEEFNEDERTDLENHKEEEECYEDQTDEVNEDSVNAEEADGDEDDDDGGWITLTNVKKHKMKRIGLTPEEEDMEKEVLVACMTSDFAMQNVMKHMGLKVMGVDGKLIQQVRTYILRCYACFKTTSIMNRMFCPKCGNKTLKRVAVTLNPDGTKRIWVNTKRPINIRGTKFSLPMPKGGKHARNPILAADQKEAKKHASRLSYKKVNPLHVDYDTLNSPFAVRDVYSRASQLGYIAGKKNHQMYWEKKNPNEGRRTTGKRKK
ncbi:RNA-binding protein NOB1-like isoform X1 [Penaeus japonicus]|uniref:RNA-binding protein NOB1-like isoform X1 n=1 Tax=Penaeus japonicus TaxID=27405 RepID=UPI001C70E2D4|nr:RNA-binding protein NOB1-like isoform X1 [Penaeus japonicus]